MIKPYKTIFWFLFVLAGCSTSPSSEQIRGWDEVCAHVHGKKIYQTVSNIDAYLEVSKSQITNFYTGEVYEEQVHYGICKYGPKFKTYGYNCQIHDATSNEYKPDSPETNSLHYVYISVHKIFAKDGTTLKGGLPNLDYDHPSLDAYEIYDNGNGFLLASSEVSEVPVHQSEDWGAFPLMATEGTADAITGSSPGKKCGEWLNPYDVFNPHY